MEETSNFAKSSLGIRKPVEEVFEAFINPDITTKFWFTHSSGNVARGGAIAWKWQMYNLAIPVVVIELEQNQRIVIEWGEAMQKSTVKWEFKALTANLTYVTITNYKLQGKGDDLIDQIRDSTKGFTFVLAGLKAWLEHKIQLKLVEDAFPKEMMNS